MIIFFIVNIFFSYFFIKGDIKEKKIFNSLLKKYFIFLIIFKSFDFYFFPISINYIYYLISILLPFIFYYLKIWGAGDSKLLTLYFLALPNFILNKESYIYILKYLNLLFVLSFFIYFVIGIYSIFKNKFILFNKIEFKENIYFLLLLTLSLNIFNNFFNNFLNFYFSLILNLIFIFFLKKFYDSFLKNHKILTIIFLILGNVQLKFSSIVLKIILTFGIFISRKIICISEYKIIKIDELNLGMILSENSLKKFSSSKIKGLPILDNNNQTYKIQSIEDIEAINKWKNSKYGENTIEIEKTIPFSIYICMTYLISFIYFYLKNKGESL